MAKERGKYPGYEGSAWSQGKLLQDTYKDLMEYRGVEPICHVTMYWEELRKKIKKYGMRNGNVMAIAPTATIASIVGASESIAPDFSNLFVYSTMTGEAVNINEHLVKELKAQGLWARELADQIYAEDGDVQKLSIPRALKKRFKTAFQIDQLKLIEMSRVVMEFL